MSSTSWVITRHDFCWDNGIPIAVADTEEAADAYIEQNRKEWQSRYPHGCLEPYEVPNITTSAEALSESAEGPAHTRPP